MVLMEPESAAATQGGDRRFDGKQITSLNSSPLIRLLISEPESPQTLTDLIIDFGVG